MIKKILVAALTLKVSLTYVVEKDAFKVSESSKMLRPTIRFRFYLAPKFGQPRLTLGVSEITRDGLMKPYAVVTAYD